MEASKALLVSASGNLIQQGLFDVSNEVQSGGLPGREHLAIVAGTEGDSDALIAAKAGRMHMMSRLRSKHFYTPIMADSAMDVMLSLLIGELQSSRVSDTALAVGNMLSPREATAIIDKLVYTGLVISSGEELDPRTVWLTPLGSSRMRSFVSAYPGA